MQNFDYLQQHVGKFTSTKVEGLTVISESLRAVASEKKRFPAVKEVLNRSAESQNRLLSSGWLYNLVGSPAEPGLRLIGRHNNLHEAVVLDSIVLSPTLDPYNAQTADPHSQFSAADIVRMPTHQLAELLGAAAAELASRTEK